MVKLEQMGLIYTELYEAITHFYGRQQLAIRAVVEQGVHPESMRGASAWQGTTPQRGTWGKDWRFFFHGGGCELTHVQSGEPINWEGPVAAAFSAPSFVRHLTWRLAQGDDLPLLRAHVASHGEYAVAELIQNLVGDGILSPDYHLSPAAVETP